MAQKDNWLSWLQPQNKQMEQFYDSEDYDEPEQADQEERSNQSHKNIQKQSHQSQSPNKHKMQSQPLHELPSTSTLMLIDKLKLQKSERIPSSFISNPTDYGIISQPPVILKQFQHFQLFSSSETKTNAVINHLIAKSSDNKLAQRLKDVSSNSAKQGVQINSRLKDMNAHDLNLLNQHRLVLTCLEETLKQLFCINQYDFYNKINFQELILNSYSQLTHTINFFRLQHAMKAQIIRMYGQQFDNIALHRLVQLYLSHFKSHYEHKREHLKQIHKQNMKSLIEQQKKQQNDRNLGIWDRGDDRNNIGPSRNYDQTSKLGLFSNRQQQYSQFQNQDIFNYRLHRTITFLQKHNILDTNEPVEKAIDYACFIIKLTDLHIRKLLAQTITLAQLSAKSKVSHQYDGFCDEFTYFSGSAQQFKDSKPDNYPTVLRYAYPSILSKYHELRYIQMFKENRLQTLLYPELYPTLSKIHSQTHPQEKTINDYYYHTEIRKQILDQHRYYQQPATPHNHTIKIQPQHVIHALQQHPLYSNSKTIYRMRAVY